jgi:hypothetical protein
MSIRASSSHDILWENVFVPEEVANRRSVGSWDSSMVFEPEDLAGLR